MFEYRLGVLLCSSGHVASKIHTIRMLRLIGGTSESVAQKTTFTKKEINNLSSLLPTIINREGKKKKNLNPKY